ncbi:hypothetical protein C2845_PM07G10990 [Panicum miliaceum]|uniref:Uncharacterized protein n=1 Tax=Panicum miliaceum TaxID=4540 RepID=A0A3L6SU70_PANMI|nr:hypothetical protein C2845_PM07G10990 [Panicum miliaceum]
MNFTVASLMEFDLNSSYVGLSLVFSYCDSKTYVFNDTLFYLGMVSEEFI